MYLTIDGKKTHKYLVWLTSCMYPSIGRTLFLGLMVAYASLMSVFPIEQLYILTSNAFKESPAETVSPTLTLKGQSPSCQSWSFPL